MDIIAFDPSLRCTGVYIKIEGKVDTSFSIEVDRRIPKNDALAEQYSRILTFMASYKELAFQAAVVEGYAFGVKNSRAMIQMGEIGGIIRAVLGFNRIPVIEIAPYTWKGIALGAHNVRAKKKTAKEKTFYHMLVHQKFGRRFRTTDEADAFMMAWVVEQIVRGAGAMSPGALEIRKQFEQIGYILGPAGGQLELAAAM